MGALTIPGKSTCGKSGKEKEKPSLEKQIEPMDLSSTLERWVRGRAAVGPGGSSTGCLSKKTVEQRDFEALSEHLLLE